MGDSLQKIVDGLVRLESVTGIWEIADRRLAAGDPAFVADLGVALWHRYGNDPAPPWQYGSAFDHMLRLLTLTPGTIQPALRLMSVTIGRRQARYAASLLASAHPAAGLEAVFSGNASEELRACLLQELVLRGADVHHRWTTSSHWSHHPLAWLPRSLRPLEGQPPLPSYHLRGGSGSLPGMTAQPVRGHGKAVPAQETSTASETAAISAAVRNWAEGSNGRTEARTFILRADLDPDAVGATLLSLDLNSVPKLTADLGRCTPAHAWRQLFTAASAGGAYNTGEFGAYGRLHAWQSIAALAGAPPDASATDVETLAHQCTWLSFAGATDWFDRVAWDIGLAVVTPDRRHLNILAATDTD